MALRPDYRFTTGAPGWGRPATADAAAVDAGLRAYMLRVYNWMASGLLLTGIVAMLVVSVPSVTALFYQAVPTASGRMVMAPTILFWIAALSPLAFMLVLMFGINRLSKSAVQALFWAFCVCMGASLSNLAFRYTGTSIASTFFVTAGMYAAVSLYGSPHRPDLDLSPIAREFGGGGHRQACGFRLESLEQVQRILRGEELNQPT